MYNSTVQEDRVYTFLDGLDDRLDNIQADTLRMQPFPKVELHRYIPPLISEGKNSTLECFPDPEEIQKGIFSFDPNIAARPDGFNCQFFQCSWNIISEDVIVAVLYFFCSLSIFIFLS